MSADTTPLRFALGATLTFAILMGSFEASRGSRFEHFLVEDVILAPTERLMTLLWPADQVVLSGRTFISGASRMNVTRGCEGVEMFLLLAAAILCWPASLASRLRGLGLGFLLAYALSIARLATLVYILRHAPRAWDSLHGFVLPLAPVLLITWYFWRWSDASGANDEATPQHAS